MKDSRASAVSTAVHAGAGGHALAGPCDPAAAAAASQPVTASAYMRSVKPLLDVLLAVVALVVVAPMLLVIAGVVLVSLGRPIVLRQTRIGLDGQPFTVYKFRTMRPDRRTCQVAFEGIDRRITHKHPEDPRLTTAGRLLRKLSLDELPQLLNVLRGEMSIVGPRPELPAIVDLHYAPWQHRRHVVKPGITGLWQVSERGNGMMHEHVDVDLDYVDRVGLLTDLKILARTIPAALTSRQGF